MAKQVVETSVILPELQQRFAWQILLGYFSLISLTLLLYILGGLIEDELPPLLATLSAISALYVAPLFQFLSQSLRNPHVEVKLEKIQLGRPLKYMLWIIPSHFVLAGVLLLTKALNVVSFKEMTIFLGFIETIFGTYMSFILTALFKLEKK